MSIKSHCVGTLQQVDQRTYLLQTRVDRLLRAFAVYRSDGHKIRITDIANNAVKISPADATTRVDNISGFPRSRLTRILGNMLRSEVCTT
jgi:hypothetical protein